MVSVDYKVFETNQKILIFGSEDELKLNLYLLIIDYFLTCFLPILWCFWLVRLNMRYEDCGGDHI